MYVCMCVCVCMYVCMLMCPRKPKRHPKWHFLKCFNFRNITRNGGPILSLFIPQPMDLTIFFKSQGVMRDRITPHSLIILRLPGIELCSNAFLLMLYWPRKLFKGFDSYEFAVISPCSYFLIFSAFCPLPSHLTPPDIPAAEQPVYKATF